MRDRFLQFWKMTDKHVKLAKIAKLKTKLHQIGLKEQLSMYGIATDCLPSGEKYRRIEIFSDKPFMDTDVEFLYRFFSNYLTDKTDSVFVYHNQTVKEMTLNV
jgi:hypothetical protein